MVIKISIHTAKLTNHVQYEMRTRVTGNHYFIWSEVIYSGIQSEGHDIRFDHSMLLAVLIGE